MRYVFVFLLGLCLGVLVRRVGTGETRGEVRTDTIVDTVVVREPVAVSHEVVRYVTVRVPVRDTVFEENYAQDLPEIIRDSVEVELPITRRVYADSMYRAVVSGWMPRLEEVEVYPRTVVRRETVVRRDRLGVGVQGGLGVTPKGVLPYVGVGVSWRL